MGQPAVRPIQGGTKQNGLRRPAAEAEIDFVRRPMVRWLDPHQLVDTSARVLASGLWSAYTDNRELQAMVPAEVHDRSASSELWLDYVSDLGDGFNSTYTVASLLARPDLELVESTPGGGGPAQSHTTVRGQILVMGGDQVYPVPKGSEYENRLLGPYRAAMPGPPGQTDLFVIPGSHDWYDGLVNFTNIFCRHRDLGALRTSQTRSYFALALPHRWWLWGIDLQFGDFIDEAQLRYFADLAAAAMEPGDRIILSMAKEVDSGPKSSEVSSDRNLAYLTHEVVEPAGARVEIFLKSGRHYYCRYEEQEGSRQLITAGGGGAFLHPTHQLPERSSPHGAVGEQNYRRAATYPSAATSKKLRKRVFLLPAYNLPLAAVLGTAHVMLAFLLRLHLSDQYLSLGAIDLWRAVWESPAAFLLILLLIGSIGGMVLLAHDASGLPRLVLGVVHSLLQIGGLVFVFVVASQVAGSTGDDGLLPLVVFLVVVWVVGGVGGVFGIAGYFWATNCLGYHGNEVYAPLHHEHLKNFLRLHIDADGGLTIYPVGIDRVGRHWTLRPDAPADTPWFTPADGDLEPRLIEPPIRIEGRRRQPPAASAEELDQASAGGAPAEAAHTSSNDGSGAQQAAAPPRGRHHLRPPRQPAAAEAHAELQPRPTPNPAGSDQLARRRLANHALRSLRRSSSDVAPQTPASWLVARANSRHSSRASHARHTILAASIWSMADPVVPTGKKRSGSVSRQDAFCRQSSTSHS